MYTATATHVDASPHFWQDLIEEFGEALGQLSLDHVVNMSLSLRGRRGEHVTEEESNTLDLVPLFRAVPNLYMLLVQCRRADDVLTALQRTDRTADDSDVVPVACPKLGVLRLQEIVLDNDTVDRILSCFRARRSTCDEDLNFLLLPLGSEVKHLDKLAEEHFQTTVC